MAVDVNGSTFKISSDELFEDCEIKMIFANSNDVISPPNMFN